MILQNSKKVVSFLKINSFQWKKKKKIQNHLERLFKNHKSLFPLSAIFNSHNAHSMS